MLIKNTRHKWFSDCNCFNTKISKVEYRIPGTSSLVTKTVLNTRTNKVENKIFDNSKYITTE